MGLHSPNILTLSFRALGRFGRALGQTETYLLVGAPRYHTVSRMCFEYKSSTNSFFVTKVFLNNFFQEANALAEEGAVFQISKTKNLPLGDITENCDGENAPCLFKWIEYIIRPAENETRTLFGHQIKTFKRDGGEYFAIGAPRSNAKAEQGGQVYVYENL